MTSESSPVWFSSLIRLFSEIFYRFTSIFKPASAVNGSHYSTTFGEVLNKYEERHLPTVALSTRVKQLDRINRTLHALRTVRMAEMTPERIAQFICFLKKSYVQGTHTTRYNYLKELRDLHAIFNFYKDQFDFKFSNPIRPYHRGLAVMAEIPEKNKKISAEEILKFFEELPEFYRRIAIIEFYAGARIGEVLGIQVKNVDMKSRILTIKEVMTFIRGVPTLKAFPKNGKPREVYLNDTLFEIFEKLLAEVPAGCPYLINDGGKIVRYNRVNVAYNRAWKKAGLGKFSGSHVLRYGACQAARLVTGSLDAVASVSGHTSIAMAQMYSMHSNSSLNKSSVLEIEKYMKAQAGAAPLKVA